MKTSTILRILLITIVVGLFVLPITKVNSHPQSRPAGGDIPPVFQDGEWLGDFWTWQLSDPVNVDIVRGHMLLRIDEYFNWTQTLTSDFANGEFFHTEAISDSVRLALTGLDQYFTTGTYTSPVLNAGKPVDWSFSNWTHSGVPDLLSIEYRTGNTPTPDSTWTNWESPREGNYEYICAYTFDSTECDTIMSGIDSSQYIQYRASFNSNDPDITVALYDIDLEYGTHPNTGTASSVLVAPIDLLEWESVIISSTVPASTTLVIDVLAADGTVLLYNVGDGDSLASINPHEYPAIKLRATLTTTDASLTPYVDLWGLRWSVINKLYLPVIIVR